MKVLLRIYNSTHFGASFFLAEEKKLVVMFGRCEGMKPIWWSKIPFRDIYS